MYPAPVTTPDITTTTGGGGGGSSVNGSRADVKGKGKARDMGMGMGDGSEDEDGWRDVDRSVGVSGVAVNGETVRDGLVAFRREMGIKGLVWGLAWGLAQVGIWGDRY